MVPMDTILNYRRCQVVSRAESGPILSKPPSKLARMTDDQQRLYELLLSFPRTEAATKAQRRSPMEFVIQHGWWYDPCDVPVDYEQGTIQECHKNAQILANERDSLIYCEGFALANADSSPVLHAWVTDGTGKAIDTTWDKPGVVYAGVPFRTLFVRLSCLKSNAHISLIDDWTNGFPLLNDLGERPDVGLETVLGNGVERIVRRT